MPSSDPSKYYTNGLLINPLKILTVLTYLKIGADTTGYGKNNRKAA
jgi:hypothetical protein